MVDYTTKGQQKDFNLELKFHFDDYYPEFKEAKKSYAAEHKKKNFSGKRIKMDDLYEEEPTKPPEIRCLLNGDVEFIKIWVTVPDKSKTKIIDFLDVRSLQNFMETCKTIREFITRCRIWERMAVTKFNPSVGLAFRFFEANQDLQAEYYRSLQFLYTQNSILTTNHYIKEKHLIVRDLMLQIVDFHPIIDPKIFLISRSIRPNNLGFPNDIKLSYDRRGEINLWVSAYYEKKISVLLLKKIEFEANQIHDTYLLEDKYLVVILIDSDKNFDILLYSILQIYNGINNSEDDSLLLHIKLREKLDDEQIEENSKILKILIREKYNQVNLRLNTNENLYIYSRSKDFEMFVIDLKTKEITAKTKMNLAGIVNDVFISPKTAALFLVDHLKTIYHSKFPYDAATIVRLSIQLLANRVFFKTTSFLDESNDIKHTLVAYDTQILYNLDIDTGVLIGGTADNFSRMGIRDGSVLGVHKHIAIICHTRGILTYDLRIKNPKMISSRYFMVRSLPKTNDIYNLMPSDHLKNLDFVVSDSFSVVISLNNSTIELFVIPTLLSILNSKDELADMEFFQTSIKIYDLYTQDIHQYKTGIKFVNDIMLIQSMQNYYVDLRTPTVFRSGKRKPGDPLKHISLVEDVDQQITAKKKEETTKPQKVDRFGHRAVMNPHVKLNENKNIPIEFRSEHILTTFGEEFKFKYASSKNKGNENNEEEPAVEEEKESKKGRSNKSKDPDYKADIVCKDEVKVEEEIDRAKHSKRENRKEYRKLLKFYRDKDMKIEFIKLMKETNKTWTKEMKQKLESVEE